MCAFTVFVSFQPPQPLASSSQTQPNSVASSGNRVSRFKYFALNINSFLHAPAPVCIQLLQSNCTTSDPLPTHPTYPSPKKFEMDCMRKGIFKWAVELENCMRFTYVLCPLPFCIHFSKSQFWWFIFVPLWGSSDYFRTAKAYRSYWCGVLEKDFRRLQINPCQCNYICSLETGLFSFCWNRPVFFLSSGWMALHYSITPRGLK